MRSANSIRPLTVRKSLLLGALALGGLLPIAAEAGDAVIPIASNQTENGANYLTKIWVTNQGGVSRGFSMKFVAADANGVQARPTPKVTVRPGATVLLNNVAPAGRPGMLIASGAPQLVLSARLEGAGPNGAAAVANLPVITGAQVAVADATLLLQGLSRRPSGLTTSIHVVNAARQTATCTLKAFRRNGQQIAGNMTITNKPLSLRSFEDALGVLNENDIVDARFLISCNKPFYAFARVQRTGTTELEFVAPSATVGRAPSLSASLNQ